jgi:hypothetical protein
MGQCSQTMGSIEFEGKRDQLIGALAKKKPSGRWETGKAECDQLYNGSIVVEGGHRLLATRPLNCIELII